MEARSRRQSRFWLPMGLAALLAAISQPAIAEPRDDRRTESVVSSQRVDLVQASRIARSELGGEIIKAELTRYQGMDVYMVRLLDQGRVREALVDAATGEMLTPGQSEKIE
ncbi:PepSY domain-containing protein [Marinobacterium sediminicola]|uniref:Peptidase propeptide and YPEB domain-containing protein n=1 Tax=Marinobacterium sediminicola TaxID=518898 RepID=A0ABY1RZ56_9GAMM|nr:PepSY domain-containing protein [Marinobacterium sediminicola]ULG69114.1 PepSY domain-containing protein [Marinobacterium sediminicola]SMR73607.1 Peptidase propeptide and YPEB domain-containing protein [Marinobacterium sediminicola]